MWNENIVVDLYPTHRAEQTKHSAPHTQRMHKHQHTANKPARSSRAPSLLFSIIPAVHFIVPNHLFFALLIVLSLPSNYPGGPLFPPQPLIVETEKLQHFMKQQPKATSENGWRKKAERIENENWMLVCSPIGCDSCISFSSSSSFSFHFSAFIWKKHERVECRHYISSKSNGTGVLAHFSVKVTRFTVISFGCSPCPCVPALLCCFMKWINNRMIYNGTWFMAALA